MSGRDLVVLGTASQAPTRARNHNGYLLRWDREGLLFDPGEGTQRQFALAGVAANRVTRILLTHLHGDHCLGLPGVLQRLAMDGVETAVPLHFPASGRPWVERLCDSSIGGRVPVQLEPVDDSGAVVAETPLRISALPLQHRVPTLGWRVEEPPARHLLADRLDAAGIHGSQVADLIAAGHLDVGSGRIRLEDVSEVRAGRSAAVVMDTAACDNAVRLAEGVDLLLCEATFLEQESFLARDYGHLTAREAATIAREAGVGLLVLTHFSGRYADLEGHRREAAQVFPDVVVATDLATVPFPAARETQPPFSPPTSAGRAAPR